jgi:hypothetical protein
MHYFKEDNGVMICQIKVEDRADMASSSSSSAEGICGTKIRVGLDGGKNLGTRTGNMKKHLQRWHPNEYEIVKKSDDEATTHSSSQGIYILFVFFVEIYLAC